MKKYLRAVTFLFKFYQGQNIKLLPCDMRPSISNRRQNQGNTDLELLLRLNWRLSLQITFFFLVLFEPLSVKSPGEIMHPNKVGRAGQAGLS